VATLAALCAGAAAAPSPSPAPSPADRAFVNGRVWTANPAAPPAQAIRVRGDRIAAVGTDAEIRRLAGPGTTVVDLHGRFVAPGFDDAHLHFLVVETVDLSEGQTVEEV